MALLQKENKVYIAGSTGLVGGSIFRLLLKNGYKLNKNLFISKRNELDLTDSKAVNHWFLNLKPDIVIIAAAKVGGIMANNSEPVDFLLENLKIQNNLIEASWRVGVKRLLFLGSSCIYPKLCKQPIKEKYLLTGELESTNEWYAIAKIAGLKLCQALKKQYDFDTITLLPSNLYGPGDNYDLQKCHVMPALIRRIYEAKIKNEEKIICWGSGKPLREFLYVDDLADASLYVLKNWNPDLKNSPLNEEGALINWLNIGSNQEISIKDLAFKISKIIGYKGKILWDTSKPDGTPRKKLNTQFIEKLGWQPKTNLDQGIKESILDFKKRFVD
tara:strand:+ start:900 stop:1889 length:990 start_codon:yes stop_codon:yes gene_type:complete